jgi:hypothetical protein
MRFTSLFVVPRLRKGAAVACLCSTLVACTKNENAPPTPKSVTVFEKKIADSQLSDVVTTRDGNLLVTGLQSSFGSFSFGTRLLLLKLTPAGDTLWTKTHTYEWTNGGAMYRSRGSWGNSILAAADGSIIVVGSSSSSYFNNTNSEKTILWKFSSHGDLRWAKPIGDPHEGLYGGGSLVATADEGYLVLLNPGEGQQAQFEVVKVDKEGNVVRTLHYPGNYGGDIQATADGNFVLTGTQGKKAFLTKITPAGTILWTSQLGEGTFTHVHAVVQSPDGGYALTGHTTIAGLGRQILLLKTNALGQQQAAYHFGTAADDVGLTIQLNEQGEYIVGGYSNSQGSLTGTLCALRIAATGAELSRKVVAGSEGRLLAARKTTDGGLLFCGHDGDSGYLLKTTAELQP